MLQSSASGSKKLNIDALVTQASTGDERAYAQLYGEYYPKISHFVAYRVAHRETAEDIVADIFIKTWETLQGSSEVSSFNAWIFTVARNKIIDHYRTKREFSDLFELENLIEYEDNAADAIDLDIASKKFLRTVDNLVPDQQQVLRLKFLEDLSNDEIAAVMDKTPGTIRVIQHRALAALKNLLNPKTGNTE